MPHRRTAAPPHAPAGKTGRLDAGVTRMPDESTILRFRHLLEANLSIQLLAAINATLRAISSAHRHDLVHLVPGCLSWHALLN